MTTTFWKVALFEKHAVEYSEEVHWLGSLWIHKQESSNEHAKLPEDDNERICSQKIEEQKISTGHFNVF